MPSARSRQTLVALAASILVLVGLSTVARAQTVEPGSGRHVLGAASADMDAAGELTPVGEGKFKTQGRVYVGRSLGRAVADDVAVCFTGRLRSVEDWMLVSPRMAGSHDSVVSIRSERGLLVLRLRGQMEFPSASGNWEIVRGSDDCASLRGDGTYTATFATPGSSRGPDFRLTYEGEVKS
ncbi:MAG: hypothetical protein IT305_05550 [Chloroflexi bacterium]|nr:hypothetical protein [Chloroflexota bacterium]